MSFDFPDLGKIPYSECRIVGVKGSFDICGPLRPTYATKDWLIIPYSQEDDGVIPHREHSQPKSFLRHHIERGLWPLKSPQPATQAVSFFDESFRSQFQDLTGQAVPAWTGATARLRHEEDITLLLGSNTEINHYAHRIATPLKQTAIQAARAGNFDRADEAAGLAISRLSDEPSLRLQTGMLLYAIRLHTGLRKPSDMESAYKTWVEDFRDSPNFSYEKWTRGIEKYAAFWSGPAKPGSGNNAAPDSKLQL